MKLKELRFEKKLTLKELGKNVGIARSSLHRYETLKRFPPKDSLKLIKDFYQLSENDLSEIFLEYFYE